MTPRHASYIRCTRCTERRMFSVDLIDMTHSWLTYEMSHVIYLCVSNTRISLRTLRVCVCVTTYIYRVVTLCILCTHLFVSYMTWVMSCISVHVMYASLYALTWLNRDSYMKWVMSYISVYLIHASLCAPYMGWLRLVGSLKWQVSFAKEPYKRDDILQKRPIILRSLLIVATPYVYVCDNLHLQGGLSVHISCTHLSVYWHDPVVTHIWHESCHISLCI